MTSVTAEEGGGEREEGGGGHFWGEVGNVDKALGRDREVASLPPSSTAPSPARLLFSGCQVAFRLFAARENFLIAGTVIYTDEVSPIWILIQGCKDHILIPGYSKSFVRFVDLAVYPTDM